MDPSSKLILQSVLETKDSTILQFVGGLCRSLLAAETSGRELSWSAIHGGNAC
jgi:hypothetical protein